jgi:signal transduction histidine kinase/DNA-binding response OmpR family regulator
MTDIKSLPKILYVEDNAEARALVRRLLAGEFVLLEAGDPLNGIELARDTQPDLVLLDINLPNMTGVDVAIRLRSILKPGTPIVAISADISDAMRSQALAAGLSGFLTKPIDIDTFEALVHDFLGGKREVSENTEKHLRDYQSEVVERLEARVRELTDTLNRNDYLRTQNQMIIDALLRRQKLLEAGARVSHSITSILDLDELLHTTAQIICDEFGLYFAGIFLLVDSDSRLELHAGHGAPGTETLEGRFSLPVDTHSMVGRAVLGQKALIALDVSTETGRMDHPLLANTRSEMALPLVFKERTLGAITFQSVEINAFAEEDVTALQSLADQIAIAIRNAQLLRQLEAANQELVRSKTFEAIATATGEAIHWVGNKAAPVPGSVKRVREDLLNLLAAFRHILAVAKEAARPSPLYGVAENIFEEAELADAHLAALADILLQKPEKQLRALISLESMLEDLHIIENSAATILSIKEDLIGPARQRKPEAFSLCEALSRLVEEMSLPKGVVTTKWPADLPNVFGDPRQIDQVFNNLIKNAWEAMDGQPDPRIHVTVQRDDGFLLACVRDNGPGIPREVQEKIWVSFFTTKAGKGGTGLGLSACLEIARQNSGKIWVESEVGKGAVFYVQLPVAQEESGVR